MSQLPCIVWFKRDLRIQDHAPLLAASHLNRPVVPLYIVEPEYWQQPFASRRHWHFIHDCLVDLNKGLTNLGQPLIIKVGEAVEVIDNLQRAHDIKEIFAHEETGNGWTYARDLTMARFCKDRKILLHEFPSNGVVRRLRSRDDWSRIRNSRMAEDIRPKPKRLIPVPVSLSSDALPDKDCQMFGVPLVGSVQKGGRNAAVSDPVSYTHLTLPTKA